jgi:DNA-binding CsgD family transcriptional regulator/PAS domain-containing protein
LKEVLFMASRLNAELLSSIIGDIYDCAINPSGWSAVLSRITLALDAAYSTIALSNTIDLHNRMAAHSPWDVEQLNILNDDYGINGVPGLDQLLVLDVDEAWSTMSVVPEHEVQQTKFYQNWAQPQGLRDACLVKFVHSRDRIGMLACITRADRDIVGPHEHKFISLISPHLRRAAMIGDLLDQARVEAQIYQSTLNRLATAVVLTNANGHILYANAAAEQMFDQQGPILKVSGNLRTQATTSQHAMNVALQRASQSDQVLGGSGIGIPLTSPDKPPAVAYVLPLSAGTARAAFKPATAAVFISTHISASPPPAAVLAALFDLTPAEARVVLAAVGNNKRIELPMQLQVSENTLKTHLSRIYKKTQTNSIAELVQVIATTIGATRQDFDGHPPRTQLSLKSVS